MASDPNVSDPHDQSDSGDLKVFAAPILRGGRFDDHAIPVEVLPQFLAYKNLVSELAMALYRARNNRVRVPAHFEEAFQLKLRKVTGDCAVPVLARPDAPFAEVAFDSMHANQEGDYYAQARDLIAQTVQALVDDQPLPDAFPEEFLKDLLELGKFLNDDESLEFRGPLPVTGPRYDAMVRVRLETRLTQPSYRAIKELQGAVVGFDWENSHFRLRTLDGYYVPGVHNERIAGTLAQALTEKKFSRVTVVGEVTFAHDHVPLKIRDIKIARKWSWSSEASLRLVEGELESLTHRPRGWTEKDGIPAPAEHMPWFVEYITTLMVEQRVPAPVFFLVPDGSIQAMWRQPPYRVEAEINLVSKAASVNVINIGNDEEAELDCALDTMGGRKEFLAFLTKYLADHGGPQP
jgi:hypothetical protein